MPNSEMNERAAQFTIGKSNSLKVEIDMMSAFAISEIALFAEEAAKMCEHINDNFPHNKGCHSVDASLIRALAKKYAPQNNRRA